MCRLHVQSADICWIQLGVADPVRRHQDNGRDAGQSLPKLFDVARDPVIKPQQPAPVSTCALWEAGRARSAVCVKEWSNRVHVQQVRGCHVGNDERGLSIWRHQ
eukprot:CAMPEP_0181169636 /NCGR_PEP_ID=MMETSP1096-20121128/922_1 /TAXON_ID=156174 ORGANISM="Chrysochromulina ericina, Strain CCMP281" /NCGR_SAMPLE_ID=MMETSP1096 /ASSEMBLY_ACC=CAM_ASM_000453 /LENGTH=103 /DNA_ID=CAMNT_0023257111 /DNA_START=702 /DNA_END=1013 /DNA_ORIENTATION=-